MCLGHFSFTLYYVVLRDINIVLFLFSVFYIYFLTSITRKLVEPPKYCKT